ncbi:hypothetical protein D3C87_1645610 [compost metagenome]
MVQQGVGLTQHRHALHRIGRTRQAIIEDAEDIEITALQRLPDQALGMTGGADDGDVGSQRAFAPPIGDQQAPYGVQGQHQAQQAQAPAAILGPGSQFAMQDQTCREGRGDPASDNSGDRRQMRQDAVALVEPV